jgi:hypothetical protein
VFVVPRAEDYRTLHRTLLLDFYGALIWHYAKMSGAAADLSVRFDESRVDALATLGAELARARLAWAESHRVLLADVLGRPVHADHVSHVGHFALQRFTTPIDLEGDGAHIGEAIVDESSGEIAYLKTYRLSDAQSRRAHLLRTLAANDWNLERAAKALRSTRAQLLERIGRSGFADLLKETSRRS